MVTGCKAESCSDKRRSVAERPFSHNTLIERAYGFPLFPLFFLSLRGTFS